MRGLLGKQSRSGQVTAEELDSSSTKARVAGSRQAKGRRNPTSSPEECAGSLADGGYIVVVVVIVVVVQLRDGRSRWWRPPPAEHDELAAALNLKPEQVRAVKSPPSAFSPTTRSDGKDPRHVRVGLAGRGAHAGIGKWQRLSRGWRRWRDDEQRRCGRRARQGQRRRQAGRRGLRGQLLRMDLDS